MGEKVQEQLMKSAHRRELAALGLEQASAAVLALSPDDTLVITVPGPLSVDQHSRALSFVRSKIDHEKILILSDGAHPVVIQARQSTDTLMEAIEAIARSQRVILDLLTMGEEEEEGPARRTLDGEDAGSERDTSQSLG